MLHRLCEPPSIPLSFSLATILPRRGTYHYGFGSEPMLSPLPRTHRLGLGLPRYLIPFAPLAFAHSASEEVQHVAFATGVPSDINAFHRSTGSSTCPYLPRGRQYPRHFSG